MQKDANEPAPPCPLCGRPMYAGQSLNEHHLVPKSLGGEAKALIHRVCHSKIHSVFSEVELAKVYNNFEKLRSDPRIASFIKWVRKQSPQSIIKHRRPKR